MWCIFECGILCTLQWKSMLYLLISYSEGVAASCRVKMWRHVEISNGASVIGSLKKDKRLLPSLTISVHFSSSVREQSFGMELDEPANSRFTEANDLHCCSVSGETCRRWMNEWIKELNQWHFFSQFQRIVNVKEQKNNKEWWSKLLKKAFHLEQNGKSCSSCSNTQMYLFVYLLFIT